MKDTDISSDLFPVESPEDFIDVFLVDDGVDEQGASFTQSKVVTFAAYRFSSLFAHLVFVDVQRKLERYVVKNKNALNKKMLYRIPIDCNDYPEFRYRYDKFVDALEKFQKSPHNFISFSWIYDSSVVGDLHRWIFGFDEKNMKKLNFKDGNVLKQSSVIFSNILAVDGDTSVAYVDINPVVLPFLLYRGRGIGYTLLDRLVMSRFRNPNSFQMYGTIMEWSTRKNFETVVRYDIADLRMQMALPDSYSNTRIRERILEPVMKDFEAAGSPVNFTFKFVYDPSRVEGAGAQAVGGRKEANVIVFTLHRKYIAQDIETQLELRRKAVLGILTDISDPEKRYLCSDLSHQVVRNSQHEVFLKKASFFIKKCQDGGMKKREFVNTMLKVTRELTGVDLRSDRHINNAARKARRDGSANVRPGYAEEIGNLFG